MQQSPLVGLLERVAAQTRDNGVVGNLEIREPVALAIGMLEQRADPGVEVEPEDARKPVLRAKTHDAEDLIALHALGERQVLGEVAASSKRSEQPQRGPHRGSDHVAGHDPGSLQHVPGADVHVGRAAPAAGDADQGLDAELLVEFASGEVVGVLGEDLATRLSELREHRLEDGGRPRHPLAGAPRIQQDLREFPAHPAPPLTEARRTHLDVGPVAAPMPHGGSGLEGIERCQRQRIAKLMLGAPADRPRVVEERAHQLRLDALEAKLILLAGVAVGLAHSGSGSGSTSGSTSGWRPR